MEKDILDDFKGILTRMGFSEGDFSISEKDLTDWGIQPITPIKSETTVRRKSTKKRKTYYSGHLSTWLSEFENDLKRGIFN